MVSRRRPTTGDTRRVHASSSVLGRLVMTRNQPQVAFFKGKGYGLIVPDMLGYAGTEKPLDPADYKSSLISKDIIDILDAEKIDKAVFIGHDWGSMTTSRIVQYFPERVIAFAVLATGYQPPLPHYDYEKHLTYTTEKAGYEIYGYWAFNNEEDSVKLREDNFEKFFNLMYPEDPKQWMTDLTPTGAFRTYLSTKPTAPSPSWLTEEEKRFHSEELLKGGLAAPTCWYKYMLSDHMTEDDKGIPLERYKTDKPAFLGATLHDCIAIPGITIPQTRSLCENLTVREFQSNHWVQLQKADELNAELEAWLRDL
ncbi:hypothetical protein V5O48_005507 [Marasmius crinis-equi]|uniref:AB hydrolase-1 domain-containing protein n=1 Tax=Marasmius crinis-equi TaxID=585013 RepID=A0ABR3FMT4_9AGAR